MDLMDLDYFRDLVSPGAEYEADGPLSLLFAEAGSSHRRTGDSVQIPTPPESNSGGNEEDDFDGSLTISISTAFYPGAPIDPQPPDAVIASSDNVFFYVHSHKLLSCSSNGFNSSLPMTSQDASNGDCPVLPASETAAVLNIVLHSMYNVSFAQYAPTVHILIAAVETLYKYGACLKTLVAPSMPLYQHLTSVAPLNPIDVYTLASHFDLQELSVATSSHLLSFPLSSITDDMALRMGPVYLKRLFFLHLGRLDAFKRILLSPPPPHPPTRTCNFAEQKQMVRVWALATAYFAWDAKPDLSVTTIKQVIIPLIEKLSCSVCRGLLHDRAKNLLAQWSVVKNTI